MSYTKEEIKNVLWDTFNIEAEAIELTDENNGNWLFKVYPTEDTELGVLSNMAQELYDSYLFEVTMRGDHLDIEYLNPYVLERKQFHLLYEALNKWISFDDKQIASLKKKFASLNVKYANNPFYKSVMAGLEDKKKLSMKQWEELSYLLANGKTKYEAGILSTKN